MEIYIINEETIALLPIDNETTKVIEQKEVIIVKKKIINIIKDSCKFYGCTYLGRKKGSKDLLGIDYKLPIIIEESKNIICFPTSSTRSFECNWILLNKIKDYRKLDKKTIVLLENGQFLLIDCSYYKFNKEYLNAIKLDLILNKKKNYKK